MAFSALLLKIWIILIVAATMLVTYLGLLIFVAFWGNSNKWLISQMVLMCLGNIFMLSLAYGYYHLLWEKEVTVLNIVLLGSGGGMSDGFFAISHFLLADKYRAISRRMPKVIERKPELPETTFEKVFFWLMMFLCIISGPCKAAAAILFRVKKQIHKEQPSKLLEAMIPVFFDLNGFCQIVAGVMLVQACFHIRSWFVGRND